VTVSVLVSVVVSVVVAGEELELLRDFSFLSLLRFMRRRRKERKKKKKKTQRNKTKTLTHDFLYFSKNPLNPRNGQTVAQLFTTDL